MFTHDIIKIKLSEYGYLPNYPFHMISDGEMCDGFMNTVTGTGYFYDEYPCLDASLMDAYKQLILTISYNLLLMKFSKNPDYELPDWVYSYMIGSAISINSNKKDTHDLLVALHTDNVDDDFDEVSSAACLDVSRKWLAKSHQSKLIKMDSRYEQEILEVFKNSKIYDTTLYQVYMSNGFSDTDVGYLDEKPPTMFGEPHVIKSLRVSQANMM